MSQSLKSAVAATLSPVVEPSLEPDAPGRTTSTPALSLVRTGAKRTERLVDTDISNGQRLVTRYGSDIRYAPETGWLVWDGRRWSNDENGLRVQSFAKETAVAIMSEVKNAPDREAMRKHAKRSQSRRAVENMIELAKSEPGISTELTDFDADQYLLNLQNGTLNLKTGELQRHRREDLITKIVHIPYAAGARCDRWFAFLMRVTDGDQDLCDYLKRMVGYLVTGCTSEQVLHFLYGSGANGKSVFCEILRALLGDYAVVSSPDLIMLKRHAGIPNDVARLRGARVALMNETAQGSKFDEAKLKDLTGGDSLTARYLHKEFFDFAPTHKLVIRGNHKPTIYGNDEGIWRRLRLIPFTVSIPQGERDLNLLDKLKAELPGILHWALEGYLEWQAVGLKPPAIVTEAVREYRDESDTLGRFIAERCTVRVVGRIQSSAFLSQYQQFCEHAGERPIAAKDLPSDMARRGFEWKRTNTGSIYLGIELSMEG